MVRGRGSNKVALWFVWIMIIMIFGNNKIQVESKNCVAKCLIFCAGDIGNPLCLISCVINCMKSSPEALCFCNIGCAISKCTKLNSGIYKEKNNFQSFFFQVYFFGLA